MIALQFRRVHSVEVVGPRSLNSTPLRSMWSRQEQINAPYTLPRQRESGRNRPYGCSMPPTSRPHFRVGSMIHRTVFDMPVTGPDPAVAPEKMPAWTHPKTPRGDRDLKGKWASADTIHYRATVDDPTIYTGTRKVALPLRRNPDYRIYEYACHERNLRASQFHPRLSVSIGR